MAFSKTLILAGLASMLAGAALAQGADDPASCRDDVVKFCPTFVGKADDMKKCLLTHKDKLNATCKKAVEASRG